MSTKGSSQITLLLEAFSSGDESALDSLTPLIYDELKRLARWHMRGEHAGHTLDTTGLVHEAFLKLAGQSNANYANRSHFFAIASMTMRRILVNWARDKQRLKRGGDVVKVIDVCRGSERDEIVFSVECGTIEQAARSVQHLRGLLGQS